MTPYRPAPPSQPLSRTTVRMQVAAVTICLSVMALMFAFCACGSPSLTLTNAAQAADVAAYTASLHDCVHGSANRAQAERCIADVDARWCGLGGELQRQGGCFVDAAPSPAGSTSTGATIDGVLARGVEAGWVVSGAQGAAAGVVGAVVGDAGGER